MFSRDRSADSRQISTIRIPQRKLINSFGTISRLISPGSTLRRSILRIILRVIRAKISPIVRPEPRLSFPSPFPNETETRANDVYVPRSFFCFHTRKRSRDVIVVARRFARLCINLVYDLPGRAWRGVDFNFLAWEE